jgi:SRSO17 transposase
MSDTPHPDLREALEEFVQDVFGYLAYQPQRSRAGTYVQGLMLTGLKRKSVQAMAMALGVPDQNLEHFVATPAWDYREVVWRLAARTARVLHPTAWILDDHPFPRYGKHLPGVARQHLGGRHGQKTGWGQVAVSLHAVSPRGSSPLHWRLFLPRARSDDLLHRAETKIPPEESHTEKWRMALEMLDELVEHGHHPPLLLADCDYGKIVEFRSGLAARKIPFLMAIPWETNLLKATGTPVTAWRRYGQDLRADELAAQIRYTAHRFRYRDPEHGHKARYGWFAAVRVHLSGIPARRAASGETLPECTLLVQWRRKLPGHRGSDDPFRIWMTDLLADTPLSVLVRYATARWEIETDYRDLEQHLGLGEYEGRSWDGFHHHAILVSAAHLFCLERRLDPKALVTA